MKRIPETFSLLEEEVTTNNVSQCKTAKDSGIILFTTQDMILQNSPRPKSYIGWL